MPSTTPCTWSPATPMKPDPSSRMACGVSLETAESKLGRVSGTRLELTTGKRRTPRTREDPRRSARYVRRRRPDRSNRAMPWLAAAGAFTERDPAYRSLPPACSRLQCAGSRGNFGSEGGIRLFAAIAQRILRSSSPLATLELVVTWAMRSLRSDDILRPGGFEVRHNAERVLPSPIAFVKDTLLLHIPVPKLSKASVTAT